MRFKSLKEEEEEEGVLVVVRGLRQYPPRSLEKNTATKKSCGLCIVESVEITEGNLSILSISLSVCGFGGLSVEFFLHPLTPNPTPTIALLR